MLLNSGRATLGLHPRTTMELMAVREYVQHQGSVISNELMPK